MSELRRDSAPWIEEAVRSAAARLPAGDPLGHVFYEDRLDSRIRIASDGGIESAVRGARGAAIVSRTTRHLSDPGPDDLDRLAREAAAAIPPRDEWMPAGGGDGAAHPRERPSDSASRLEGWLARSMSAAPLRAAYVEAALIESIQKIWVGRPEAPVGIDVRRSRRLEVTACVQGGGGVARAAEERVLHPDESFPEELVCRAVARAAERATVRTDSAVLPAGSRHPSAVFAPGVAGIVVHELVGHALEGDVVAAGRSRLAGERDRPFPSTLRIVDDPRRGRAPWTIDDEGAPSCLVPLIEGGAVAGVLRDRAAAVATGSVSTGHGRRSSYLERVLPRMGCTFIECGTSDPAEILSQTERGIYVRRMAAIESDPRTGRASFVVTDADVIRDGALAPLCTPLVIVLDVIDSLASIDAIGNDLAFDRCLGSCVRDGQPMATSVGAPTIRIGVIRALSVANY